MAAGTQCSTFLRLCLACAHPCRKWSCKPGNSFTETSYRQRETAETSLTAARVSTSDDVDVVAYSGCGMTSSLQYSRTITFCETPANCPRIDDHSCCYKCAVCVLQSRKLCRSIAGSHVVSMWRCLVISDVGFGCTHLISGSTSMLYPEVAVVVAVNCTYGHVPCITGQSSWHYC